MSLSRYQLFVVGCYVILVLLLLIFAPGVLSFGFSFEHFVPAIIVLGAMLIAAYVLWMRLRPGKPPARRLGAAKVAFIATYALFLIALPEEILFRGMVQRAFEIMTGNAFTAIIAGALVFGAAHLPNKATSWKPQGWNWRLAAAAALVGLPLGYLFAVTGSLLLPTLFHGAILLCTKLYLEHTLGSREL